MRLVPTGNARSVPTKYWVVDPGDHNKFADLCAGMIKHYDKGWANGVRYNVEYYEIWNEPNAGGDWNPDPA